MTEVIPGNVIHDGGDDCHVPLLNIGPPVRGSKGERKLNQGIGVTQCK